MPDEVRSVRVSEGLSVLAETFRIEAAHLNSDASCALQTAQFLTALSASKPGGRLPELGTGVGLSTASLLAGVDAEATVETVELEERYSAAAAGSGSPGDVPIFADIWPGKFHAREAALDLLAPGRTELIDDLLP